MKFEKNTVIQYGKAKTD